MGNKLGELWNKFHSVGGGYLVRRYISFLGHIIAMVIVMKLTWMGGMTEGYFTIYLTFIAGHATMEKYISHKQPKNIQPGKTED